MQKAPAAKQPNSQQTHDAAIAGEALDTVMAEFMYQTIVYAKSFSEGTWHPHTRTLFQIAQNFPKN
jgi:hypothetical protein